MSHLLAGSPKTYTICVEHLMNYLSFSSYSTFALTNKQTEFVLKKIDLSLRLIENQ